MGNKSSKIKKSKETVSPASDGSKPPIPPFKFDSKALTEIFNSDDKDTVNKFKLYAKKISESKPTNDDEKLSEFYDIACFVEGVVKRRAGYVNGKRLNDSPETLENRLIETAEKLKATAPKITVVDKAIWESVDGAKLEAFDAALEKVEDWWKRVRTNYELVRNYIVDFWKINTGTSEKGDHILLLTLYN